jgi:methyl-accepting chemotaxis protein
VALVIEVIHKLDPDDRAFLHHLVRPLVLGINRLERHMTEISDFLDTQNASLDAISAALGDVAADVAALLAKAGSAGVFSADEQAKADQSAEKLAAVATALANLDTEVGDQDGSDTPPAEEPTA